MHSLSEVKKGDGMEGRETHDGILSDHIYIKLGIAISKRVVWVLPRDRNNSIGLSSG